MNIMISTSTSVSTFIVHVRLFRFRPFVFEVLTFAWKKSVSQSESVT